MEKEILRGQIWACQLGEDEKLAGEQRGYRPVLILQNDIGNKYSPTVIVASITTKKKKNLPTHVDVQLREPSVILLEQIFTVSKERLNFCIKELTPEEMEEVEIKMLVSLGVISPDILQQVEETA